MFTDGKLKSDDSKFCGTEDRKPEEQGWTPLVRVQSKRKQHKEALTQLSDTVPRCSVDSRV